MLISYSNGLEKLHSIRTVFLRHFACHPAAFLAVRRRQFLVLFGKNQSPIRPYKGQNQGFIFVSDPQLRVSTKNVAENVDVRYPIHLNHA